MGGGGGGGGLWNLMLSFNLLKSKIPICGGGGFTEFDVEFKFAKIQIPICGGGFTEFDVEFKFAKIQNSICGGRGGRGGLVEPISNFDAESKFTKKKSFRAKIGTVLFWILSTEWFAILRIANHKQAQLYMLYSI